MDFLVSTHIMDTSLEVEQLDGMAHIHQQQTHQVVLVEVAMGEIAHQIIQTHMGLLVLQILVAEAEETLQLHHTQQYLVLQMAQLVDLE